MANYLPVLLISVSTNTVPDDSSLSTLPRAQVDYLSHDWQEEDVWKSWRNMTRQKNEIANGMRLENASWRTWWKKRNKLKTVSPEKLNWLKDSDVTWLYGPLHTAADWTPPPKPEPVPDSLDGPHPTTDNQFDLFSPNPNPRPRKPILKHRSISELLISDLIPTSPVFSPMGSEDDDEDVDDTRDSISPAVSSTSFLSFAAGTKSKRPIPTRTKSDTQVTRWGAGRTFRKDSPPRIDPPVFDASKSQNQSQAHENTSPQPGPIRESASQDSNSSGGVGRTSTGTKKKHISFNTFVEQRIAIDTPKKSTSGFFGPSREGNWVAGRTTYVVDDGYEEDEEDSEEEEDTKQLYRRDTPVMRSYSGSPDDDDDDGVIEMRSSSHRNHTQTKPLFRSQSKVSTASSSSSTSTASTNTTNSSSTNSSQASTDTTSPAESLPPSRIHQKPSSPPSTTAARRYSSSTCRPFVNTYATHRGQPPPPIRISSEHVHVTIAPIAPTILKTTGRSEGFRDEGSSNNGFGSWSTKGMWSGQDISTGNEKKGKGKVGSFGIGDKEGQSSDGTPVELVYVPPFGSNYSRGMGDDDYEGYDGYLDEDEDKKLVEDQGAISSKAPEGATWNVYHHRTGVSGSVGLGNNNGISIPSQSSLHTTAPIPIVHSPTPDLPTVIVDNQATTSALSSSGLTRSKSSSRAGGRRFSVDEEDPYDFFGGPDLGEDYCYARRGGRGYDRSGFVPPPSSSAAAALGGGFSTGRSERQRERERERRTVVLGGEERQSRSRSRSQSRTPSPAFISSPVSTASASNLSIAPAPTASNGQVQSGRKRCSSALTTPSASASSLTSDLLSPSSQRGRPATQPQSQTQQSRGRSSTRTSSSSSSWEQEGSSSVGSSPMGSLSPDGLIQAGGRKREKEKERRNERGRERTSEKMLNASEVESAASSRAHTGSGSSNASTTRNTSGTNGRDASGTNSRDSNFSSTTSSCSSSISTVMGPPPSNAIAVNISPIGSDQEERPKLMQPQAIYSRRAEEQRSRVPPTPSSSPAVGMRISLPSGENIAIDQRDKAKRSTPSDTTSSGTMSPNMGKLAPSSPPPPPAPSSPMPSHGSIVGHTRSSSYSESVSSPSKLRSPPLRVPPPLLAKPSTSLTAVSSSPASPIISAFTTASNNKGLASPSTGSLGEHTIVGKAVDIVSSAGAFLGLWQHSSMSEG